MTVLPPPAETLARVSPGASFAAGPAGNLLHVIAGDVTRCGAKLAASWTDYRRRTTGGVPARRLCRRCLAGLPAATRRRLVPTATELRKVNELEAREATAALVAALARLRTEALVDGSAYERTVLVEAALAPRQAAPRGAAPLTRAERATHVAGPIATGRELTLLELLNELDPSRPTVPGYRVYLLDPPALGTPVHDGGTYDARAYDWRRKGRTA